jgi:hypothetical protein
MAERQASSSFFEKKEPKKLLSICRFQRIGPSVATRQALSGKSFFASFFSKKEDACLTAACLRFFGFSSERSILFSLRDAYAVALSQKEDSCLPQ